MELIACLSLGIAAGWIASISTRTHAALGLGANLLVGAGGALLGHAAVLSAGTITPGVAWAAWLAGALVLLVLLWRLGVRAQAAAAS
jgi:uncharacterized membrane protein YeaQ/YmgE (transglycosylase-associated protein family)